MNTKIIFIVLFILFSACRKENSSETEITNEEKSLNAEQLAIIDNIKSVSISDSVVKLPNGQLLNNFLKENDSTWNTQFRPVSYDPFLGSQAFQQKNMIIARFLKAAEYLSKRSNFQYAKEGNDAPAQNGLAYSFGQKDFRIRQKPPAGSCKERVYGLDCSGELYQIFKKSEFNLLPVGPSFEQIKPETVQRALKEFPSLKDIVAEDRGKLQTSDLESGDIIYWSKLGGSATNHIGIILKEATTNKLYVYQSNGSSWSNCEKNFSESRGPRLIPLNDNYFFGTNSTWKVTRMIAKNQNGQSIGCNNLSFSCGPFQGGDQPSYIYPRIINLTVCGGNPPYRYKTNSENWTTSNLIIIYSPGTYVVYARDSQGCQIQTTMVWR
jgi:hypothetical protein